MKNKNFFLQFSIFFIFACILGFTLVSCSQRMVTESENTSERLYAKATIKHRRFVKNSKSVSVDEWCSLINEFQRIINLKPEGKNSDDVLYAIGSCYLWMYETKSTQTLSRAIKSFERIVKRYPESDLVPDAYWWTGYCYRKLGDYEQAAIQYQNLIVKYPAHKNYENALYYLAECYERQKYISSAVVTYQTIVENGKKREIVKQALKRLSQLQLSSEESKPVFKPSEANENKVKKQEDEFVSIGIPVMDRVDEVEIDTSLVGQLGLGVRTIVIDPGHGGTDPGAVSGSGLCEKDITLTIAKKLKILLDRKYKVYLTREDDRYLGLQERTKYAIQKKADLFISIHINSSDNSRAFGVETYYLSLASDESAKRTAAIENAVAEQSINELESIVKSILKDTKVEESRKLAEMVQESIVDTIKPKDRGVKRAPFIVLIGTKVPAILVELGFLSNSNEAKLLCSKSYQNKIAEAIADAVERYNFY